MTELSLTTRRLGEDHMSRTEEYELVFRAGESENTLNVKYQAARAYEINRSLDSAAQTARDTLSEAGVEKPPSEESLFQFVWKAMQSVKYEEGASKTSTLEV
jgi:hypothetical protein